MDGQDEDEQKVQGKYEPYKFSGKNYEIDYVVNKNILRTIRKWAI